MYSIMEEWYSSHNQWRSVSDVCMTLHNSTIILLCLYSGTSDLMNFIFHSVATKKCFNVTAIYVKGHVVDSSIVLFKHKTLSVSTTVREWNCIDNLTTNKSYNVLGIDSDSPVADINTSPAVNLTEVYVPIFSHVLITVPPTTTSSG